MSLAARIGDMHVCPMVTGLVPHVGGPIITGCSTVVVGGMPAARVGDIALCVGPPDVIAMGSPTVMIGGSPAARLGDPTVHGGVIITGFGAVVIGGGGGSGSSQSTTLKETNSDPDDNKEDQCKIEVATTPISGPLGIVAGHLSIRHTDENGNVTFYRGGPEYNKDGKFGKLVTDYGKYEKGATDYDPSAPTELVASGSDVCEMDKDLKKQMDDIEKLGHDYDPLSTNSNATVFEALENMDLEPKKPGWKIIVGEGTDLDGDGK